MGREERQHGVVVFYEILPGFSKHGSRRSFSTVPTTTGTATRVPTNHSRYTGRCGGRPRCRGCHTSPVSKARLKAKGAHKIRYNDMVFNHWARFAGASAGRDMLGFDYHDDGDDSDDDVFGYFPLSELSELIVEEEEEEEEDDVNFCHVQFVHELRDEDGWCLVGGC